MASPTCRLHSLLPRTNWRSKRSIDVYKRQISYLYDAAGTKLRVVHSIAGNTTTTDYCGNVIYENVTPKTLLTDAGFVSLNDNKYHYYLQDHQGNNRVVVSQDGAVEEAVSYTHLAQTEYSSCY